MKPWLEAKLAAVSGKSKLAEAIRYALLALGGPDPLPRRWADRNRQQRRRDKRHAAHRARAQNFICFAGGSDEGGRYSGHPRLVDRNLQDERCRSASVARRRPRQNRQPPSHEQIDELLPWAYINNGAKRQRPENTAYSKWLRILLASIQNPRRCKSCNTAASSIHEPIQNLETLKGRGRRTPVFAHGLSVTS